MSDLTTAKVARTPACDICPDDTAAVPKHQLTIYLIEKEIVRLTGLIDYCSRVSENWPALGANVPVYEKGIAELQHTREVLVLIGS